jgi:hypothetical protein
VTKSTQFTTVTVSIRPEGDAFVATSSDVPGLHVWAQSIAELKERVCEAIRILYKVNRGMEVVVGPDAESPDFTSARGVPRSYVVAMPC